MCSKWFAPNHGDGMSDSILLMVSQEVWQALGLLALVHAICKGDFVGNCRPLRAKDRPSDSSLVRWGDVAW